jgi:RND family efflux transporter MFP subunit
VFLVICCFVALFSVACDRQPDAETATDSSVMPLLVTQCRRESFSHERVFSGLVVAREQVRIKVLEAGQVRAVHVSADASTVTTGQALFELQSPELNLMLKEAKAELDHATVAHQRILDLAKLGLAAQTEVDGSRASVERAQTRQDALQLRKSRLTVRAPTAGTIVDTSFPSLGQWCSVGEELARVFDPTSLVVEVTIPESLIQDAQTAQEAILEPANGIRLKAEVGSISAGFREGRGGRVLTLRPERGTTLTSGARFPVRLVVATRENAVTVPVEALFSDNSNGWRVAVGPAAGATGRIRWVNVVAGPNNGERVVIASGLEGDEWVALAGGPAQIWGYTTYLGVGQ